MALKFLIKNDVLFRFCIKCGCFLGIKPGYGVTGISHAICDNCLKSIRREK